MGLEEDVAVVWFEVEVVVEVKGGNWLATSPANQSRLSALSGPPQLFWTARERAGQRLRERATACSKRDWRVSVYKGQESAIWWMGNRKINKGRI